jgi:hypothetical protein
MLSLSKHELARTVQPSSFDKLRMRGAESWR